MMCFTNTAQINAPTLHHLISTARKKREQIADKTCNGDLISAYNYVFLMIPVKKTALFSSYRLTALNTESQKKKKPLQPQ
jgi:hypothetical protein